jgi:Uma2 family endonuclease
MTVATETKQFTAEDLLRLADQGRYELVDGQLVEKPMAKKSNELAARVAGKLFVYLDRNPIARIYNEQGFRCFGRDGDKGRIRKPDVAVVLNDRVATDAGEEAFFSIRPDIAIEVMSPTDLVEDLQDKLEDYFSAQVPLVVIIHPTTRSIEVRRGRNEIEILSAGDVLSGEPVLSGFELKVEDLFRGL